MQARVNPNQQFRSDFLFDHLPGLLSRDLGCGAFEVDTHFSWWSKEWQYISPQKTQADYNAVARECVIRHVGPHRLKVAVEPLVQEPLPQAWTPCVHWGGTRVCDNCRQSARVAGAMAKAEALFQQNHKFVRSHINTVLNRRCQEVTQATFDDLVNAVWHKVAASIDSFKDPGEAHGAQRRAWLKSVIETVVTNHFR